MKAAIQIFIAVLVAFMGITIFGGDALAHPFFFAMASGFVWLALDMAGGVRC